MRAQTINRVSSTSLLVLAVTALLTVLAGYTQPLQSDEGALAHVFQRSVAALLPAAALFVATSGALYHLEHVR